MANLVHVVAALRHVGLRPAMEIPVFEPWDFVKESRAQAYFYPAARADQYSGGMSSGFATKRSSTQVLSRPRRSSPERIIAFVMRAAASRAAKDRQAPSSRAFASIRALVCREIPMYLRRQVSATRS